MYECAERKGAGVSMLLSIEAEEKQEMGLMKELLRRKEAVLAVRSIDGRHGDVQGVCITPGC